MCKPVLLFLIYNVKIQTTFKNASFIVPECSFGCLDSFFFIFVSTFLFLGSFLIDGGGVSLYNLIQYKNKNLQIMEINTCQLSY